MIFLGSLQNNSLQVDVWSATTGKSATQLQPKQGHFLKPDSKPKSEQGGVLWAEPGLSSAYLQFQLKCSAKFQHDHDQLKHDQLQLFSSSAKFQHDQLQLQLNCSAKL